MVNPIMMTGNIEELILESDRNDDLVLDFLTEKTMEKDRKFLKKSKDLSPIIHVATRCMSCPHIFVYNVFMPGDRNENHVMIKCLPQVVRNMLKEHKCKEHGFHRYVGYVFTSLARMRSVPANELDEGKLPAMEGDFNKYIVMTISSEKVKTAIFEVATDMTLRKDEAVSHDNVKNWEGGMVNVFSVVPKGRGSPGRPDIEMHR